MLRYPPRQLKTLLQLARPNKAAPATCKTPPAQHPAAVKAVSTVKTSYLTVTVWPAHMLTVLEMEQVPVRTVVSTSRCMSGNTLVLRPAHLRMAVKVKAMLSTSTTGIAGRGQSRQRGRAVKTEESHGGCTPSACAPGGRLCPPAPTLRSCASTA